MLAQGQSSSAKRGRLAVVSSGLIFLKKKKNYLVKLKSMCLHSWVVSNPVAQETERCWPARYFIRALGKSLQLGLWFFLIKGSQADTKRNACLKNVPLAFNLLNYPIKSFFALFSSCFWDTSIWFVSTWRDSGNARKCPDYLPIGIFLVSEVKEITLTKIKFVRSVRPFSTGVFCGPKTICRSLRFVPTSLWLWHQLTCSVSLSRLLLCKYQWVPAAWLQGPVVMWNKSILKCLKLSDQCSEHDPVSRTLRPWPLTLVQGRVTPKKSGKTTGLNAEASPRPLAHKLRGDTHVLCYHSSLYMTFRLHLFFLINFIVA